MLRTLRWPRSFEGWRPYPPDKYLELGLSNADGPDYEGTVFRDGTVVIHWLTKVQSISIFANWDEFRRVHGHPEYGTQIRFHDEYDEYGDPAGNPGTLATEDAEAPVTAPARGAGS